MTDLPPELHALLSKARTEHDPSADDAERVRARLYAGLAVASLPGGKPALAGKAGSSSVLSAQLASKLLVAALVVGGGVGWWAMQRPAAERRAQPRSTVASPSLDQSRDAASALGNDLTGPPVMHEPGLPLVDEGARAPARAEIAPAREPSQAVQRQKPAQVARKASSRVTHGGVAKTGSHAAAQDPRIDDPEPSPASADQPRAEEPTRQEELALLRTALEAINGGRPARALAVLESHALHYPGSVLAEERSGLRVLALCALQDLAAGRREQAAFLRDHARSPLAARVRAACVTGAGE